MHSHDPAYRLEDESTRKEKLKNNLSLDRYLDRSIKQLDNDSCVASRMILHFVE